MIRFVSRLSTSLKYPGLTPSFLHLTGSMLRGASLETPMPNKVMASERELYGRLHTTTPTRFDTGPLELSFLVLATFKSDVIDRIDMRNQIRSDLVKMSILHERTFPTAWCQSCADINPPETSLACLAQRLAHILID